MDEWAGISAQSAVCHDNWPVMVCHPETPSQTLKVEVGLPAGSWWELVVEGSMLEIVRPVLELVLVSRALDRDSNTFFLHPDILATQVLS